MVPALSQVQLTDTPLHMFFSFLSPSQSLSFVCVCVTDSYCVVGPSLSLLGLISFDEVCLWRDEYDEQGYETLVEENSAW